MLSFLKGKTGPSQMRERTVETGVREIGSGQIIKCIGTMVRCLDFILSAVVLACFHLCIYTDIHV